MINLNSADLTNSPCVCVCVYGVTENESAKGRSQWLQRKPMSKLMISINEKKSFE